MVRRGLERQVADATVTSVEVHNTRSVRRHPDGTAGFAARLVGRRLGSARRRGKYLWLPLDSGDAALAHLGMSGQLLVRPPGTPDETHLRVRVTFADGGRELRFVDQRTFGGLSYVENGAELPAPVAHIAADPMEEGFDITHLARALRRRRTGLKRALLDQGLVSGIGNIYADEGLWRARLHYARPTETLTRPEVERIVAGVREVMVEALARGGTSFDRLYVDVTGNSGYFDSSLAVYGRAGRPCPRCGAAVRREPFMGRSSYFCPTCQRRPRRARW